MPREKYTPKTTGRRPASPETLAELKEHFDKGTRLTQKELADQLNLSKSTVKYHKGKWRNGQWGQLHKSRHLSNEEENAITKTLKKWKEEGKILSPRTVRQLAYNYCEKRGLTNIIDKWEEGLASYDWFAGYAKRNKDVMSILHVSPLMDRKRGRRDEKKTRNKSTSVEKSDNDSPPVKKTRAGRLVKANVPATSVKAIKNKLAAGKKVLKVQQDKTSFLKSSNPPPSPPPILNDADDEVAEQHQVLVSATIESLVDSALVELSMDWTEKELPHSRNDLDRVKGATIVGLKEATFVKAIENDLASGNKVLEEGNKITAPASLNDSDNEGAEQGEDHDKISASYDPGVNRVLNMLSLEMEEKNIRLNSRDLDKIKRAAIEKLNNRQMD